MSLSPDSWLRDLLTDCSKQFAGAQDSTLAATETTAAFVLASTVEVEPLPRVDVADSSVRHHAEALASHVPKMDVVSARVVEALSSTVDTSSFG